MSGSLEAVIKHMIKLNNHKSNISFPAIVVNTDNLVDGFIDVKPLVNNMNPLTGDTIEYPPIRNVQVLTPSTKSSSITVPVTQGDTVELLFQSVDIVDFVNGNTESHDPYSNGWGNLANVVALVGFTPYQHSAFNPNNYSNDFNNQDLNIVHNKNTGLESSVNISASGSILQKAPNAVTVDSPLFDVKSDLLNANNAIITTGGDVVVQGQSLNQFMIDAPLNLKGSDGDRGWSPVLAVENRGQYESVLKITDWVGGEGDKPSEQGYIGSNGIVSDILDAINIRGARGKSGAELSADTIQDIVNSQFTVGAIMDLIQGQIDESALTKDLTSKIDKIEYNELAISQETQSRIDSILDTNSQISIEREQRIYDVSSLKDGISTEVTQRKEADVSINSRVDSIVTKSDGNTAAIQQEATARIEADTAIGSRIDTVVSNVDNNTAAIVSESTTRADEDSALSTRIETVSSKTNSNTATIISLQETLTDELGSQAERIETMQADYKPRYADKTRFASSSRSVQWTYWKTVARDGYTTNERIEQLKSDVGKNNASITESLNTLVTMDESLASSIGNLRANTEGNISAINTELSATTAKTNATASSVSTLQTTVAGNTASIQTAQSSINGINLQYTVKLDSGGKVSGFGIMNDGATSAFDIRADRFSISAPVGKPNDVNGTSPFMVLTSPTEIDGVMIPAGTYMRQFYAAKGSIQDLSVVAATLGHFKSAESGARLEIKDSLLSVYDNNGTLRVRLGIW